MTIGSLPFVPFEKQHTQEMQGFLESVLEASPFGVCILHAKDYKLLYSNSAANQLMRRMGFAYSVAGFYQALMIDHPDFHQKLERDGYVGDYEICRYTRPDQPIWLMLACEMATFRDEVTYCLWMRDITQRKKQEIALQVSEARLIEAQRLAKVGHYQLDVATKTLTWSNQVFRILGEKPNAFRPSEEKFSRYVHPDDREKLFRGIERCIAMQNPFSVEYRVLLRDGTKKVFFTEGKADYNPHGQPTRIYGFVQDITERKHADDQLKSLSLATSRAEDRLRDALDTMSDAFMLWDKDDRLIVHNQKIFELYPNSQGLFVLGRTFTEIIHLGVENGHFEVPQGVSKEAWIKQRIKFHKSGNYTSVRCVKGRWFQIKDQLTNQGNIVSTSVDVSLLKAHERELEIAKEQAEQATRAKSAFLAMMSHEVRTPLNGIIGMAQLLIKSDLDYDQYEHVKTVLQSSESLLTILNDLLDFSKLEAGKLSLEDIPFDIQTLVESVVTLFTLSIQKKDITIDYFIDPQLSRYLKGDPGKIRQILMNLIGNAIKFTEEGSVHIRLKAQQSNLSDRVKLYVGIEDTGIGLSKKVQKSLFAEFVQADSSISRRFGGTGLGLAVCKKLIDLMGGEIGVESHLKQGSTFWFTLDLKKTKVSKSIDWQDEAIDIKLPALKILLVEDNQLNQKVTKGILYYFKHKVCVVDNGYEALKQLEKNDYDLVLMDIQMPDIDGYETTRRIRLLPSPVGSIPIIAVTAHAMPEDVEASLKAGMNAHLAKPVNMVQLQQTIADVMNGRDILQTNIVTKEESNNRYLVAIDQSILQNLDEALGKDEVTDIVKDYSQVAQNFEDDVPPLIQANDYQAIQSLAHNFKSLSGSLGLKRLFKVIETIDHAARTEDIEKIKDYYQRATQELSIALPVLNSLYGLPSQRTDDRK